MFTNKNVFVRSIALIIMILMISAVALTACGDKAAQDAAANAQTTADAAKDALAKLDTDVKGLVENVNAMKADIENIDATIKAVNTKIADLEAADKVNEGAIAENAEAIATLKATAANLETAKAALEASVAALETKVADLETAKAALEAKVAALETKTEGLEATDTALEAAKVALEAKVAALEAAKADLDTKVAALEAKDADLEAAKAALEAAVATAQGDIDALEAKVVALETAKASLEEAVKTAQGDIDTLEADVKTAQNDIDALETSVANLEASIETLKNSVNDTVNGLKDSIKANADQIAALKAAVEAVDGWVLDLEDWNEATKAVISTLAKLDAEYNVFENGGKCSHGVEYEGTYYYSANQIANGDTLYNQAIVAIKRSTSVADQKAIIDNFCAALDEIPNVYEELIDCTEGILEDGKISYPEDHKNAVAGKALYEKIKGDIELNKKAVNDYIVPNPADPEDDDYNVLDWFYDVAIEYAKDWVAKFGAELKADMEYVLEQPITLTLYKAKYNKDPKNPNYDPTWEATDESYNEWVGMINMLNAHGFTYAEEVDKIDGFDKVIAAFYATELADRFAELEAAYAAAEIYNAALEAKAAKDQIFNPAVMAKHINAATRTAINNEWKAIEKWCNDYNIPSSVEDAEAKKDVFIQENYDLINHAKVQDIENEFERLIKTLREAFDAFVIAVDAIGHVTPDSIDEIEAAWDAYFVCAEFGQIIDLDGILDNDGDKTIANYYAKLSKANADYDKIMELIKNVKDAVASIEEFDLLVYVDDKGTATTTDDVTTKYTDGYVAYKAVYDALVADLKATLFDIEGWITTLETKVDKGGYGQDIVAVIGQTDLDKIDRCTFLVTYQYKAVVNVLDVYQSYTGRPDTKASNSMENQVKYIVSINWNDDSIKDMTGNLIAPEVEVERCADKAYITAQFEAAIK